MRILYHHPICPFSRQARLILEEKNISFELKIKNFWDHDIEFAHINPAMELPVLIEEDGTIISGMPGLIEYIEELYLEIPLLADKNIKKKAEIRRLLSWFNIKMYNEVTNYIINERVINYFSNNSAPNSKSIRAAKINIAYHLDYIGFLLERRKWLAGDEITVADFAAASHLSILDYLGDVPWKQNQLTKDWYSLIKSRPSFRSLLTDRVQGFRPSLNYTNLDF